MFLDYYSCLTVFIFPSVPRASRPLISCYRRRVLVNVTELYEDLRTHGLKLFSQQNKQEYDFNLTLSPHYADTGRTLTDSQNTANSKSLDIYSIISHCNFHKKLQLAVMNREIMSVFCRIIHTRFAYLQFGQRWEIGAFRTGREAEY